MFIDKSKFFNPNDAPYYNPIDDHKVVLITGGNSGIGWYTVLHLYLHGYIIYIAGRTESKVLKAIEDIKIEAKKRRDTEKEQQHPLGELNYIYIDLLDLSTVPKAVEKFKSREKKLDILINNAGIMGIPYEITRDGYEVQYQVNFVSHFLLTLQLIPQLKASDFGPRVINLSSIGHNFEFKHYTPEQNTLKNWPNSWYTWVRYGIAKTTQIQFSKEMSKKYPSILTIAIHPGIILGTDLYKYWKTIPVVKYGSKLVFSISDKVMGVSNEEGALATLRAAMDPNLSTTKNNGDYFVTGGVIDTPSKIARNEKYCKETWDWNLEQLIKKGYELDNITEVDEKN
ncbi:unnamed protein product [Candida verbasci]|uniref:Uncharacterized protein n=1 Tax=Candida verbasci TaxID=1227364 RepID=A0A9W4X9P2_9ASCO|nr:unnamed protein product [Candida verbasci]